MQYKNHLSGFHEWEQKDHAEEWLLFPENIGEKLSIDEVAISKDELHAIVTNKKAKGRKRAVVAIVYGVKSDIVAKVLKKIPLQKRKSVKEVTLDMSNSMDTIIRDSFPAAKIVTDRFHVQQLVSEAAQEMRVSRRREALKEENEAIKKARADKQIYRPKVYENGDTKKQLLARSRHLLFKPSNKWSEQQQERSMILFKEFPELEHAHNISMLFRTFYEKSNSVQDAKQKLESWYKRIEEEKAEAFYLPAETIHSHEMTILNYFVNRSINASAESFNAKLKGFRALIRGVRDKKFFLFRIAKLYG